MAEIYITPEDIKKSNKWHWRYYMKIKELFWASLMPILFLGIIFTIVYFLSLPSEIAELKETFEEETTKMQLKIDELEEEKSDLEQENEELKNKLSEIQDLAADSKWGNYHQQGETLEEIEENIEE